MSLFRSIRSGLPDAAEVLRQAGIVSDSDLWSLDHTDLHELLPGVQNRFQRYDLFNIIHPERSAGTASRTSSEDNELMRKIEDISIEAANVLKDKGCQVDLHLLDRTDLHEVFPAVEKLKWRKEIFKIIHPEVTKIHLQRMNIVKYQILHSGMWLSVYSAVIKKVKNQHQVDFVEAPRDHAVSLLFCPVISRIGSDAETAIATIKDGKPVILVFLIHSFTPQSLSLLSSWDDRPQIVLHVYLFHHKLKGGLLRCKENNDTISAIQEKLLQYKSA